MCRQSLIKACESTILTTRVAVGTTLSLAPLLTVHSVA